MRIVADMAITTKSIDLDARYVQTWLIRLKDVLRSELDGGSSPLSDPEAVDYIVEAAYMLDIANDLSVARRFDITTLTYAFSFTSRGHVVVQHVTEESEVWRGGREEFLSNMFQILYHEVRRDARKKDGEVSLKAGGSGGGVASHELEVRGREFVIHPTRKEKTVYPRFLKGKSDTGSEGTISIRRPGEDVTSKGSTSEETDNPSLLKAD